MSVKPISDINVESELSYAYLHAIASKAGAACKTGTRHEDNNGIDALLTLWGPFPNGGYLQEIDLKVQLKATVDTPALVNGHLSYFLSDNERYDDLRSDTYSVPRILVVLFLPSNVDEWISHSVDQLILRKCAYWVSLRGAPPSPNKTGITVKFPENQFFDSNALVNLASRLSRRDIPTYAAP